ncbi:MAG TPA: LCP family protein [Streptosporangiaceae bacterium]|jgi:LCP family protein required for cell wall assembly
MRPDYESDRGTWTQASAGRPARRHPQGVGRRRSKSKVILGSLAAVVALALAGGSLAAYMKYRSVWDGIQRVNVSADLTGKRPPLDPHALNILLIGSDTRVGVNGKIGGKDGISGGRSDTVMILHIAPGAHKLVVISIPRDSVVPILSCAAEDGTNGQTAAPLPDVEQVNASFAYGGPGCLWKTAEQTTGIHINDFVSLTFQGFEKVIDALHGVEICLPAPVHDPQSNLDLSAGRHHVYGPEALAFWRTREGVGEGDDPQRIQRDQFLMASLLQGIERSGIDRSPSKMLAVIDTLTSHHYVTTDSGLSTSKMLQLGEDLRSVSTGAVQFVTVPWGAYTGNAQWADSTQPATTGNDQWVQWVQPNANNLFSAIAHDTKLPATGKKAKQITVTPADVRVHVVNGTLQNGLGANTATSLTAKGFKVVGQPGNAATPNFTKSVIQYATPIQQPAAQELAKFIGGATVVQDKHIKNEAVLRLVLGSNFTSVQQTASSGSSIQNLAGTFGGIKGNVNICKDSSAFAGPDGE